MTVEENIARLIYNLTEGTNIKDAMEASISASIAKEEEVRKLVQTNNTKTENVKNSVDALSTKLDTVATKLDTLATKLDNILDAVNDMILDYESVNMPEQTNGE